MASITQNKKDGKVVSYKFKACVGRDELGKQVFKCSTWKVPEGLIPSRVEKAAQKAAADWEKQVKDEYQRDLQNPERIKEREIARKHTEFSKFALQDWFPVCIDDGDHKHTTVDFYKHNADIISELAFINEIPDTNVSCNTPCGEVYCILPVDPAATVGVYAGNSVDNEYWEFNELIYEGTGEDAYLLVCNETAYPDTEVQITFPDDTTYYWNPMLDAYNFTMGLWLAEVSDSEDGYETLDITPYDKMLLAQYDNLLNGFDSTWAIPTKEDLIGTSWCDDGYDVDGQYYLYRMTIQEESIDVQWNLYGDGENTYPDAQYSLETKNGVAVLTVDFKEFAGVKSYNLLLDIQAGLLYTAVDATDGNIATAWERQYRYLFAEEAAEPVDMVGTWELAWTEVEGYREELDDSATTIVISGESEEELTITYTDSESPSESFQDKALTVIDEQMYYECGNDRWLANVDYVDDYGTTFAVTLLDDGTLLMQMYWEIDDGVPMVAYRGFSKA